MASSVLRWRTSGRSPPFEQLQELDGELDVADAAVAGLDLGVARAGPAGLLLDAPLDGLDLVDLGEAQVFAVDERLDTPGGSVLPSSRSPATGRSLMRACRSQVRPSVS